MPAGMITWFVDCIISGHEECLFVSLATALCVQDFIFPTLYDLSINHRMAWCFTMELYPSVINTAGAGNRWVLVLMRKYHTYLKKIIEIKTKV